MELAQTKVNLEFIGLPEFVAHSKLRVRLDKHKLKEPNIRESTLLIPNISSRMRQLSLVIQSHYILEDVKNMQNHTTNLKVLNAWYSHKYYHTSSVSSVHAIYRHVSTKENPFKISPSMSSAMILQLCFY